MKTVLMGILAISPLFIFAQNHPEAKFGKISVAELEKRSYTIDTGATAIVLYDIGSTQIIGNKKGTFSLEFKRKTRIHILNKSAYGIATVKIPLFASGDMEEQLSDVKAATYNLENGKVTDYKMEKSAVVREKMNKNRVIKKFTLPAVKEGSIIEYEYKVVSDFLFNLQPWAFQSDIPHLWSEYKVGIPQFLQYILIGQGDGNFSLKDQKNMRETYQVNISRQAGYNTVDEPVHISCGKTEYRWAISNVEPLKKEVYTSTIDNYVKKLEFQLSGIDDPLIPEKVMTNWPDVAAKLLKREDFGMQLENNSGRLSPIVTSLIQNKSTARQKAESIYQYLRDNFTCTHHTQLYTEKSLTDVLKSKNGGVAEINLLLVAMLREAGISSDPVILSTVENGFVYPAYPIIGRFNYVICSAEVENGSVLLDASHPYLGFGKLNTNAYNGQARIINSAATELSLPADQLTENEIILVDLRSDNKTWAGKIEEMKGYYGSMETRQEIKAKGETDFFNTRAKNFGVEVKIDKTSIDSLNNYEKSLKLNYGISFNAEAADIIYFDPVIMGRHKHNPFKSADRKYPVELPYKISEQYILNLIVPEGYKVDEMPKPVVIRMENNTDMLFEYTIKQTGESITLRCRLELNRVKFEPEYYNALREFFDKVVAKQNEQIVFKKK